jgi:hypothetical protein
MTMQRKFQGVWIPADLWLDRSLSLVEKVMLVEIGSLQDEERGCYASNAHFAEFFGLSISRVSEIISGLAEKGYLRVEQVREGKRIVERRVYLKDPFGKPNTPSEKAVNPFGKGGEPPSEKAKGNNTSGSNTGNKPALSDAESIDALFDEFWKAYPRKVGKDAARKAFSKRKPTRELLDLMLVAVTEQSKSFDWRKDAGRFIPHPATWLNQGRWQDEIAPSARVMPGGKHHGLDARDYGSGSEETVLVGGL